uniref:Neuroendocrine convertase 2 n=1 Tax=Aceria tosichella TaxID=561515 RepID=A0A6G1SNY2_9ACAR
MATFSSALITTNSLTCVGFSSLRSQLVAALVLVALVGLLRPAHEQPSGHGLFGLARAEKVSFEYVEPLDENNIITSSFLVRLNGEHEPQRAHAIAKRNGYVNLGQVGNSKTDYHFHHPNLKIRTKRSVSHIKQLKRDPDIRHAIQQTGFKRDKRGFKSIPAEISGTEVASKLVDPQHHHTSGLPSIEHSHDRLLAENHNNNNINQLNVDGHKSTPAKVTNNTNVDPTDPYFKYQWPLKNVGQNGGKPNLDLNVEAAWAQGYTGKNVTTAIMDDGVDYMHLDLRENYNAKASFDFSSNDQFPYPRYTDDWFNSHGTRCAGEVASKRDNGICGVGIAYDSKVAGIRMLDQPYMTDIIEANSMSHEPNLIDIYSASWGPTDNGKTVDGPRNATMHAIVRGVNDGRNGKGSIYVWASGDGGSDDDCNCDGYAASMWTISINSAINTGENAHYDESCSSTLASTFSNGAKDPHTGVATTDLYDRCTQTHSGTSAAAPEAAAVYALALEANPNLTWRDIQHLTVLTSKRNSLYDGKGRFNWQVNGVGLEYNHLFGYGVLDAGAMVSLAKDWKTVPSRYHCDAGVLSGAYPIPTDNSLVMTIDTEACKGTGSEVNYIEHVQAIITLNSTRRGDLVIHLTSPMGTRSMILNRRPFDDDNKNGFVRWPFMTTHTWGENPRGTWKLEVKFYSEQDAKDNAAFFDKNRPESKTNENNQNTSISGSPALATSGTPPSSANLTAANATKPIVQSGFVKEWRLMIHGTSEPPYKNLVANDVKSKLAIVKKAHGF